MWRRWAPHGVSLHRTCLVLRARKWKRSGRTGQRLMAWHYAPTAAWHPDVHQYLSAALGPSKFASVSAALCRPPLKQSVRINTLGRGGSSYDRSRLQDEISRQLQLQLNLATPPQPHPTLPSTLILRGAGPTPVDYAACEGREVVVNRYAGEAVLKGAHVYSPGLLAASGGLAEGDLVGVSVALERPGSNWCGISRGTVLPHPGGSDPGPSRTNLFVGMGRCAAGRRVLFRNQSGLAVHMTQRVFDSPSLNGVLPGQIMLQALPSITAAQVLAPEPGSRVLDMCAAPGGKTTLLAQLMNDRGEVWALDRTHAKVMGIRSLAASFGLTCIRAVKADATQAVRGWGRQGGERAGRQRQRQQPAEDYDDGSEAESGASSGGGGCSGGGGGGGGGSGSSGGDDLGSGLGAAASTSGESGGEFAGFERESFDHILLDPPCSALGLRPRLVHSWTLKQLLQMADYQRALMHAAIALLKPGGTLVYSTCTINPAENEGNVRYALDRWGPSPSLGGCYLELLPAYPLLGGPGLTGPSLGSSQGGSLSLDAGAFEGLHGWLHAHEAGMVQRFDPDDAEGNDSIGFFVAKFRKGISWAGGPGV